MNVNKIVVMVVVIVVAVLAIYFFGSKVVGKAVTLLPDTTFAERSGGIETPLRLPAAAGDTVTVRIGARLPADKESVAFGFTLLYDDAVLRLIDVDSKVPEWGNDFLRTTDVAGGTIVGAASTAVIRSVTFDHATINWRPEVTIDGGVRLAEVNFVVRTGQTLTQDNVETVLSLTALQVLDLAPPSTDNLITTTNLIQATGVAACTADPTYCDYTNQCPSLFPCLPTDYNADLTLDNKYDGQDAQVIFGTRDARNDNNCGQTTGTNGRRPCLYDLLSVCDDGTFRVVGLTIYTGGTTAYATAGTDSCPFIMAGGAS